MRPTIVTIEIGFFSVMKPLSPTGDHRFTGTCYAQILGQGGSSRFLQITYNDLHGCHFITKMTAI